MEVLEPFRPEILPARPWDLRKYEWDGGSLLVSLDSMPIYEELRSASGADALRAFVYFQAARFVRSLDEGGRLVQLQEWSERGIPSCTVCVVKNSRLLQEVVRMSQGATNISAARHYVVLSANECLDILSFGPPDLWLASEMRDESN